MDMWCIYGFAILLCCQGGMSYKRTEKRDYLLTFLRKINNYLDDELGLSKSLETNRSANSSSNITSEYESQDKSRRTTRNEGLRMKYNSKIHSHDSAMALRKSKTFKNILLNKSSKQHKFITQKPSYIKSTKRQDTPPYYHGGAIHIQAPFHMHGRHAHHSFGSAAVGNMGHLEMGPQHMGHLEMEHPPMGNLEMEHPPMGHFGMENSPMGHLGMEHPPMGNLEMEHPPMGHLEMENRPMGHLEMEHPPMGHLEMEHNPVGSFGMGHPLMLPHQGSLMMGPGDLPPGGRPETRLGGVGIGPDISGMMTSPEEQANFGDSNLGMLPPGSFGPGPEFVHGPPGLMQAPPQFFTRPPDEEFPSEGPMGMPFHSNGHMQPVRVPVPVPVPSPPHIHNVYVPIRIPSRPHVERIPVPFPIQGPTRIQTVKVPYPVQVASPPKIHKVPMPYPVPVQSRPQKVPFPVYIKTPPSIKVQPVPYPVVVQHPPIEKPVPIPFPVHSHHYHNVPYPVAVPSPPIYKYVPYAVPVPTYIHHYHHHHVLHSGFCHINPCSNGGTCTAVEHGYKCICPVGFKGKHCEETSQCHPDPCQNYGTCTEVEDSYECSCNKGYKGTNCELLDKCYPDPCKNGGSCEEQGESFICMCLDGFRGDTCEREAKCRPINPCQNGGVCRENYDSYTCECSRGWTGINCEVPKFTPSPPVLRPMVVHHTFIHQSNCDGCHSFAYCDGSRCICRPGYIGDGHECTSTDKRTTTHSNTTKGGALEEKLEFMKKRKITKAILPSKRIYKKHKPRKVTFP